MAKDEKKSKQSLQERATQAVVNLSKLIELEGVIRSSGTIEGFRFAVVNRIRELFDYDRAVLFRVYNNKKVKAEAISNVALINREAPFTNWLESVASTILKTPKSRKFHEVQSKDILEPFQANWENFASPHSLWCPMILPTGELIGVLWLFRDTPWSEKETVILDRLCGACAYDWGYLLGGSKRVDKLDPTKKYIRWGILATIFLTLMLPLRLSVLAPMEIRPKQPVVISSPIDGIIKSIHQDANQPVKKNAVLFSFENTTIASDYEISEKTLAVTKEKLRAATQGSFSDPKLKGQLSLLEAELAKHTVERDYRKALLEQVDVVAPASGLLIYSDKNDWLGKPVKTGERIMTIADPGAVEVEINLPVGDDIVITPGADVKVFLNSDPLNPIDAQLTRASFTAMLTPSETVAYRLFAELKEGEDIPRIGARGTAKIYGKRVPLFIYLFRRPLSSLRQTLGF